VGRRQGGSAGDAGARHAVTPAVERGRNVRVAEGDGAVVGDGYRGGSDAVGIVTWTYR